MLSLITIPHLLAVGHVLAGRHPVRPGVPNPAPSTVPGLAGP